MATATCACPTCDLDVPEGLSFCPRCRAAAEGRPYDPDDADRHERQYVISLVVLSLGVFAVPRLLRSPAFSPAGKLVVGLLGALNTTCAVGLGYLFFWRWLPGLLEPLKAQLR